MTPKPFTAFRLTAQLSARLTRRRALASQPTLLVTAAAVLAGVPWSLGWSAKLPKFLATLSPTDSNSFVGVALLAMFLLLALSPSLGSAVMLAEGGGLRRLTGYPASRHGLVAGLALGGLCDLGFLPTIAPLWQLGVRGQVLGVLCVVLMTACAAVLGQALLLASYRVLTSRKLRESAGLLLPLAAVGFLILATRAPARAAAVSTKPAPLWKRASRAPAWNLVAATPPGLTASAVETHSPLPVLGLSLWCGGLLGVGAWLLGRPEAPPGESPRTGPRRTPFPMPRWLATDLGALIAKELQCLTREPFYRGGLGKVGATTAVVAFATMMPPDGAGDLFGIAGTGLLAWLAVWTAQLACNQLGGEFVAGAGLFLYPASRVRLILGKLLAHGALLGSLVVGFTAVYALSARLPFSLGLKLEGLALLWLATTLSLGAIVSALSPFPLFARRDAETESPGLLIGLLHLTVAALAGGVVAVAPWSVPFLAAGSVWLAARILTRRDFALRERFAG